MQTLMPTQSEAMCHLFHVRSEIFVVERAIRAILGQLHELALCAVRHDDRALYTYPTSPYEKASLSAKIGVYARARMAPRTKKPEPASVGLGALEVPGQDLGAAPADGTVSEAPAEVKALAMQIADDDGAVLAAYREPFGASWVLLAALPIDRVEPTPYQRELSKTHADRLASVIPKVGQFLDPLIVVRRDDSYWTPNGMHRLSAMQSLGAKSIIALVLTDPKLAYRILALNTEKAHNLKDKSLEVWRMAKGIAEDELMGAGPESDWAFEFEEPAFLITGACYEARPRFSGSVYQSVLRRCETFSDQSISETVILRAEKKDVLLELDDAVTQAVARLKEAGLSSPYLKSFVVTRINPLRFKKTKPGEPAAPADLDETLGKMIDKANELDASKVKATDLARAAGSAED